MKISLFLLFALVSSCAHHRNHQSTRHPAAEETTAMFSPWEGEEAFAKMYNAIARARHEVRVTVYSWSDSDFDKAIEAAVKNGADVKVILHPSLSKKSTIIAKAEKLEGLKGKGRASFKVAPKNMHEKFVLVDGEFLVNSSANMSTGARTKYSENFVFMTGPAHVLESFGNEFAIMWNASKDVLTHADDTIEDRLAYDARRHLPQDKSVIFYSSSMNFDYVENKPSSAAYAEGKYVRMVKKSGKKPYTVRDAIIDAIRKAEKNIYCSFNHFNMVEVSEALVEAARRGVDVRLTVDNQEFRESWSPKMIEMTPHFVENWKKLPGNGGKNVPARVKFYSHAPNPSLWLLNHHKFLLIDYDAKGGSSKSVLFTGSHNLSETAEHNQFDNMVAFHGTKYEKVQKEFLEEFFDLWNWERKNDRPNQEIVSSFTTVKDGSLPIHSMKAVSLTWEEVLKLRDDVKAIAPQFFRSMNRSAGTCRGYNVAKKTLWGCQ